MAQHIKENNKTDALKGYGGTIHTFGLKVPLTAATQEDFAQKNKKIGREVAEEDSRRLPELKTFFSYVLQYQNII